MSVSQRGIGQRGIGEVAAIGGFPLIGLLDQDVAYKISCARFDSRFSCSRGISGDAGPRAGQDP